MQFFCSHPSSGTLRDATPYFFDEVEMMDSIIIGYIGHEALTLGLSEVGCITSTMSHRNCKNGNIPYYSWGRGSTLRCCRIVDGTNAEMNDSDLEGAKTRVWCDVTSSNVDRSGNDRICTTEEQCKARHTTMKNAFYASSIFSAKGCTVKGENMYFGTGGTDDEMNESVAGEQVRVWCDADKSSVVFEESTSEERIRRRRGGTGTTCAQ